MTLKCRRRRMPDREERLDRRLQIIRHMLELTAAGRAMDAFEYAVEQAGAGNVTAEFIAEALTRENERRGIEPPTTGELLERFETESDPRERALIAYVIDSDLLPAESECTENPTSETSQAACNCTVKPASHVRHEKHEFSVRHKHT